MLGHSTVVITLDLYSHVTESMQPPAVRAMDTLLAAARTHSTRPLVPCGWFRASWSRRWRWI